MRIRCAKFGLLVSADPAQASFNNQGVAKRLDQVLEPLPLGFEVSAMNFEGHLGADIFRDQVNRLEQDLDPLVFRNLAEECKAGSLARPRAFHGFCPNVLLSVFYNDDVFGRDSPLDVSLSQEFRRETQTRRQIQNFSGYSVF